jgi:hypothetical protein
MRCISSARSYTEIHLSPLTPRLISASVVVIVSKSQHSFGEKGMLGCQSGPIEEEDVEGKSLPRVISV